MIGTSFYLTSQNNRRRLDKSILKKESWHSLKQVVESGDCDFCYSFHPDYPIRSWIENGCVIVLEGAIYNHSEDEVTSELNELALHLSSDKNEKQLNSIRSFVNGADGDFLVTMYCERKKTVIAFNDILGGMSAYYCNARGEFYLSRSLSYISCNQPEMKLSRLNMSEYVVWGFNLGDHTVFEDIKKLKPATCLFVRLDKEQNLVEEKETTEHIFSVNNRYKNKREAIRDITRIYLEGCKNRVNYALDHVYEVVNTMSGGFDSRTVAGGVELLNIEYINLTGEYKQDESAVALKVLKHIDSKSTFLKMKFENVPNIGDSLIAFKTDGKIDAHTNSVCYNDLQYEKEYFKGKRIALFGGFGGEYIRHPWRVNFLPIVQWGNANNPPSKLVAGFFRNKSNELNCLFSDSFSRVRKQGREAQIKYFYNEYYQNLVRCSGEERNRMFFYSVQPLMTTPFILAIRNRIPLNWVGFRFYRDFLKEINPKLVKIEIYGKAVDIKSEKSLFFKDLEQKTNFKTYARFIRNTLPGLNRRTIKPFVDINLVVEFFKKISYKEDFDIEYIKNVWTMLGANAQLRLLTLLEYIYECERRRTEK